MPSYRGLVFTSLAPESAMPLVIVEALEAGLPILVSLTSPHAAQLIADGVAMGIRISEGSADTASILAAMDWVAAGGDGLRQRCREVFEDRYTQAQWVNRITEVYREQIDAYPIRMPRFARGTASAKRPGSRGRST
jgi:glycosyltransferase involved in cell wall biosynthesis